MAFAISEAWTAVNFGNRGDFVLYAGVSIPPDAAKALTESIEDTRSRHKVAPDFALKFNPGPPELSHAGFIALKEEIIIQAAKHGARMFVYVVLHDIAKDKDEARRNGINTVLYHFDCFLNRQKDQGIALIDRFNDKGNKIDNHTREKFAIGVVAALLSDLFSWVVTRSQARGNHQKRWALSLQTPSPGQSET